MSIITDLPFYFYFICFLIALFYSFVLYYREKKLQINLVKKLLFILRFLLIFLITFLLLNPVIHSFNQFYQKPTLVIVQDKSSSVKENTFQVLNQLSKRFPNFDVLNFSFSDKFNLGFSEINNGKSTNFSLLFDEINLRLSDRNVSALILASDGICNEGRNSSNEYHNFPNQREEYQI